MWNAKDKNTIEFSFLIEVAFTNPMQHSISDSKPRDNSMQAQFVVN